MAANMPVLWQNALGQYGTCPVAAKAWVWAAETQPMDARYYRADAYADEVKALVEFYSPVLEFAASLHGDEREYLDDLVKFLLLRHANHRFGGNVRPPFLARGED